MNQYLNREQINELLDYAVSSGTVTISDEMTDSIHLASNWHLKLICSNYLVAWAISGISRRSQSTARAKIESLYKLDNVMYVQLEECAENFIDYLLKCYPGIESGELENEIFAIGQSYSEYQSPYSLYS